MKSSECKKSLFANAVYVTVNMRNQQIHVITEIFSKYAYFTDLVSKYAYSLKISVNMCIYCFFGPVNTRIY